VYDGIFSGSNRMILFFIVNFIIFNIAATLVVLFMVTFAGLDTKRNKWLIVVLFVGTNMLWLSRELMIWSSQ